MRYAALATVMYIFFFKKKTAYERRISDWSSDVCSSDLLRRIGADIGVVGVDAPGLRQEVPDAPQDRDSNHDDRENAEQLLSLCAVGLGVRRFGGDFGSAAFGRSRFVGHHSSPVGLLATYPPPSARIRAMSRESCRASSSATARSSATMLSSAVSWTI